LGSGAGYVLLGTPDLLQQASFLSKQLWQLPLRVLENAAALRLPVSGREIVVAQMK
jgi:hypothetical protein